MSDYASYLASVRAQEQRDKDRFMGWDSHENEAVYEANTGAPVFDDDAEWNPGPIFSRDALLLVDAMSSAGTAPTAGHIAAAKDYLTAFDWLIFPTP